MSKLTNEERAELEDPGNWEDEEDAIRPAAKSPRAVVSVAFSREDFEAVAEYASRHRMKISEFIRNAALEQIDPPERIPEVSVTGSVHTKHLTIASPRPKIEVRTPEPAVSATS